MNVNHKTVLLNQNNDNDEKTQEKEFALSWTVNDLDKFNDEIFDIVQNLSKTRKPRWQLLNNPLLS